eukprot:CAMPEP_0179254030 /NCGR_PEP_ID=MMETSP0797-20121207/23036_1 /TAXON_ID=47934 /ORGANISM="Dinophysis acuminata, Strain DAEP01" /LENGTH=461 /DNA_ID=CAMNT_0020961911 /DNA_START=12 /DNA_END=1400 /DNA_ORIENTATION=+
MTVVGPTSGVRRRIQLHPLKAADVPVEELERQDGGGVHVGLACVLFAEVLEPEKQELFEIHRSRSICVQFRPEVLHAALGQLEVVGYLQDLAEDLPELVHVHGARVVDVAGVEVALDALHIIYADAVPLGNVAQIALIFREQQVLVETVRRIPPQELLEVDGAGVVLVAAPPTPLDDRLQAVVLHADIRQLDLEELLDRPLELSVVEGPVAVAVEAVEHRLDEAHVVQRHRQLLREAADVPEAEGVREQPVLGPFRVPAFGEPVLDHFGQIGRDSWHAGAKLLACCQPPRLQLRGEPALHRVDEGRPATPVGSDGRAAGSARRPTRGRQGQRTGQPVRHGLLLHGCQASTIAAAVAGRARQRQAGPGRDLGAHAATAGACSTIARVGSVALMADGDADCDDCAGGLREGSPAPRFRGTPASSSRRGDLRSGAVAAYLAAGMPAGVHWKAVRIEASAGRVAC